jgi:hypothetical protein
MPWLLYPQRKSPSYPLDRRLGGLQSWSGCVGEVKNSQPLLGLETPIIQPVAQYYTTMLTQLRVSMWVLPKLSTDIPGNKVTAGVRPIPKCVNNVPTKAPKLQDLLPLLCYIPLVHHAIYRDLVSA